MMSRNTRRGVAPGLVARLLLLGIRAYQLTLSAFVGRSCRHLPTCSHYAAQAIRQHGAWAGFWLGVFRVMRCHPLGTHGFDPVPENVPRHEARFWRYWRHGACGARAEGNLEAGGKAQDDGPPAGRKASGPRQ